MYRLAGFCRGVFAERDSEYFFIRYGKKFKVAKADILKIKSSFDDVWGTYHVEVITCKDSFFLAFANKKQFMNGLNILKDFQK